MTRLLCLQGCVAPVRIASGSMMPVLFGAHYAIVCEDCAFAFRADATSPPVTGEAVCPNCGFAGNRLTVGQLRHGQRVIIDRFPGLIRLPRRWDLIAFRDPAEPASRAVKRVVGLPGETIAIHQGDLYVDGQIARKPIDVQRAMAVLVHDDTYRPTHTDNLPPRWEPTAELAQGSGWQQREVGYQFTPLAAPGAIDWLAYRSWRCFASPLARSAATPVLDHYGYNQNTSRGLQVVSDLSLSCRVRWSGEGQLWMRTETPRDTFVVEVDCGLQTATLRRDGALVARFPCSLPRVCEIEFGTCDRQIILIVDRRVTFRVPFEPTERVGKPSSRPLAIGGQSRRVRIDRLKVYRDVYYLGPYQRPDDWTTRTLAADREILVLGDNVPISRDSRTWAAQGLPDKSLIGRVLLPF